MSPDDLQKLALAFSCHECGRIFDRRGHLYLCDKLHSRAVGTAGMLDRLNRAGVRVAAPADDDWFAALGSLYAMIAPRPARKARKALPGRGVR